MRLFFWFGVYRVPRKVQAIWGRFVFVDFIRGFGSIERQAGAKG